MSHCNAHIQKFFFLFSINFFFQLKDLAAQTRYADDPAYTKDVRHLALPMRRNSGPDSSRRKSCSLLDGKIFDRDTDKYNTMSKKASNSSYKQKSSDSKYIKSFRSEDSTSSDETNYIRRGQSLDRNIYKQQRKMLCFQREKENQERRIDKMYNRKAFSKENLLIKSPRSMNEFTSDFYDDDSYSTESKRLSYMKDRPKQLSSMLSLNDRKYSSLMRNEAHSFEQLDQHKTKELSKFQIGKRFLKGEIGIKSFNYYLLKESLKSSKKSTPKFRSASANQSISKSEENIYEEIFFTDKKFNKSCNSNRAKTFTNYPDCELCIAECMDDNCDICKASENKKESINRQALQLHSTTAKVKTPICDDRNEMNVDKLRASDTRASVATIGQTVTPNILQYQSYNPKNPGIYKIETTPVAFTSDYNPIEDIHKANQKYGLIHKNTVTQKISSSSSDSLHHQKYSKSASAKNDRNYYDCSKDLIYNQQLRPQIYKTDSKASILSEMSIKSENSNNRYYKQAEMSDSSMGDSMFSYPAQRRYYGSAESCQIADCQPCIDGDKCSFSDNCRYECRNCDCSSSYFSSDFDDGNFSRKSSARMSNNSQISNYNDNDSKTPRYAEDFMKHINNVKKTCNFQISNNNQVTLNTNNQINSVNMINNNKNATNKVKVSTTTAPVVVTEPKKVSSHSSKQTCNGSMKSSDTNGNKAASISSTGAIPKSNKSNEIRIYAAIPNTNRSTDDTRTTKSNDNKFVNEIVDDECSHTNDEVFVHESNNSNDKNVLKQTVSFILKNFYNKIC